MRVFAISDVHLDYEKNVNWVCGLSQQEYKDDVLILAGDISDKLELLAFCFEGFVSRFRQVLFVPGNHDLWIHRDAETMSSFDKFHQVSQLARDYNVALEPVHYQTLSIVPLLGWYDFSFGQPGEQLLQVWMDFNACDWGTGVDIPDVNQYFLDINRPFLESKNHTIISFSHFLPRIDVMPSFIPPQLRYIYPVLGSELLDLQVRELASDIHVYGHSHVNRDVSIDGVRYINNAYAYPSEEHIALKRLRCIYEC